MDYIRQEAPFLKESGWNILMIAEVFKPSEEGLIALITHILDIVTSENQNEIRRIFHALEKSKSLHPKELMYLTEALDSLESYLALEKQPGISQRTSLEARSYLAIRWLEQLAKSSNALLVALACDLAEKFFENDPGRVSMAYSLVSVLSRNNHVPEAIKLMAFLQNKKEGRTIKEEIAAFCALIEATGMEGAIFYKSMGQISLQMIRKWNAKTDVSLQELLAIVQFLRTMWNLSDHTAVAVRAFKEMIKKGFLSGGEVISKEYWLDACEHALKNPYCGLSVALDIWQSGLKNWKSRAGDSGHAEFCIKLLQAFQGRQIDDVEMYAGTIFNELFNIIQSFKETDYELFEALSTKSEVCASQIKYVRTRFVKNSLGKEFLFRLQLSELAHFIQRKEWRFALNSIRIILENDFLTNIDKSYYLTFSTHLMDYIQKADLSTQDLPQLLKILKYPSLEEKIFDGRITDYISILSFSLMKAAECTPCLEYDEMLDHFLKKAKSADDFMACAPTILQRWKLKIKSKEDGGRISKADLLFKAFVKSGRYKELAVLIIFLKKHSLLEKISEGMLNNAWNCLEALSRSSDFSDLQLCRKALDILLEAAIPKNESNEPMQILKNLFFSNHPFDFTETYKRLDIHLAKNLKDVELIIDRLKNSKSLLSYFHLLQALSPLPIPQEKLDEMWKDLLSNCNRENPSEFDGLVELYALRFSESAGHLSQSAEKIILNVLRIGTPNPHFEVILEIMKKFKIISGELWNTMSLISSSNSILPLCRTFLAVLKNHKEDDPELSICWRIFLETSIRLPLSAWMEVMHGLPLITCNFEGMYPNHRSSLYHKILTKGMEGLSEDESSQYIFKELGIIRQKIEALKPSFFEPQDVEFIGRIVEEGDLEKVIDAANEIKGVIDKSVDEKSKAQLCVFAISKLCTRLSKSKSKNNENIDHLKTIEDIILNLFKNGLLNEALSSKRISLIVQRMISSLSSYKVIEVIQIVIDVSENGKKVIPWFTNQIDTVLKKLARINTSEAFILAFDLIESFKCTPPKKIILELIYYASLSSQISHKEKALTLFCKQHSYNSQEANAKALEEAAANCLGSIPQCRESWALFCRMAAQVFNLLHPIIRKKNWEHSVQNPIDEELPLIIFGESLNLFRRINHMMIRPIHCLHVNNQKKDSQGLIRKTSQWKRSKYKTYIGM